MRRPRGQLQARLLAERIFTLLLAALMTGACTTSSPPPTAASSAWKTHTDTKYGWTISYPPDWYVQPYDEDVGMQFIRGLLVSNAQHQFAHPDFGPNHSTSEWSMEGLPSDAVVLEIQDPMDELFARSDRRLPDTPLPLSLANAKWTSDNSRMWQPFRAGGTSYILRVYIGKGASPKQRDTAQQVVSSLSFQTPPSMPDVTGRHADLAVAYLVRRQLDPHVFNLDSGSVPGPCGVVFRQRPASGSPLASGTVIKLFVPLCDLPGGH